MLKKDPLVVVPLKMQIIIAWGLYCLYRKRIIVVGMMTKISFLDENTTSD